jgi:hypothetical protein
MPTKSAAFHMTPVIQHKFTDISGNMLPPSAGWMSQNGGSTFLKKVSKCIPNIAASYP